MFFVDGMVGHQSLAAEHAFYLLLGLGVEAK